MSAQPTFTTHDFYTELVDHRSPRGSQLDIIKRRNYCDDENPNNGLLYVEADYNHFAAGSTGLAFIYLHVDKEKGATSCKCIFYDDSLEPQAFNLNYTCYHCILDKHYCTPQDIVTALFEKLGPNEAA